MTYQSDELNKFERKIAWYNRFLDAVREYRKAETLICRHQRQDCDKIKITLFNEDFYLSPMDTLDIIKEMQFNTAKVCYRQATNQEVDSDWFEKLLKV